MRLPIRSPLLAALTILALAAACRTAPPPDDFGPDLPRELGVPPTQLQPDVAVTDEPAPTGTARPAATRPPADEPPPERGGDTGTPRGPFRTIGATDDPRGDHGPLAPGYADLRRITIEDDGVDARVTVTVDAPVPTPMPDGEQMALGVDLYTDPEDESDYQLLAIGTTDGWLAFLDTPDGLVRYPGSFAIDGARFVFQVRWSDLGGIRGSGFSTFLNWDRRQPVVNRVASDRAPARGTEPFRR